MSTLTLSLVSRRGKSDTPRSTLCPPFVIETVNEREICVNQQPVTCHRETRGSREIYTVSLFFLPIRARRRESATNRISYTDFAHPFVHPAFRGEPRPSIKTVNDRERLLIDTRVVERTKAGALVSPLRQQYPV